nr:transposase [Candidatus Aenigmarchaeota archaeon]
MIERVVKKGESVSQVCRNFGISRIAFYRWKERYEKAPEDKKIEALSDRRQEVAKRNIRKASPEQEKAVITAVLKNPSLSSHKISEYLEKTYGRAILSNHGVQNILSRLGLNTYQKRLSFQSSYLSPSYEVGEYVSDLSKIFKNLSREILDSFDKFLDHFTSLFLLSTFGKLTILLKNLFLRSFFVRGLVLTFKLFFEMGKAVGFLTFSLGSQVILLTKSLASPLRKPAFAPKFPKIAPVPEAPIVKPKVEVKPKERFKLPTFDFGWLFKLTQFRLQILKVLSKSISFIFTSTIWILKQPVKVLSVIPKVIVEPLKAREVF